MNWKKWSGAARRFFDGLFCSCHQDSAQDGLVYWRERILHSALAAGTGLSLVAFGPALYMAFSEGLWLLAIVDVFACIGCAGLLVMRRIGLERRAAAILLITFLVGVFVIGQAGFLSGGPAWLFAFAVLSGVLLGLRAALIASALNALALAVLAGLSAAGILAEAQGAMTFTRAVAAGAVMTGQWPLLPLIITMPVSITLSDILQVAYVRMTGGRRLFKMAPLHHHFELSGWSETQVVQRFWLISLLFAMLGVAFIFV